MAEFCSIQANTRLVSESICGPLFNASDRISWALRLLDFHDPTVAPKWRKRGMCWIKA